MAAAVKGWRNFKYLCGNYKFFCLNFLLNILLNSIASLPFWFLYRLSDLLFVVVYYILGYRKEIVRMNLKNAFPDKPDAEIRQISIRFFKDLADLAVETIKALKITKSELSKHIYIADSPGARQYFAETKSAIVLTAHFSNWEWAGLLLGLNTKNRPVQVVYLHVKNPYFNNLMKKVRTHLGNTVVKMEFAFKQILMRQDEGIVTCFLADQTPQPHQIGLWTRFLNQDTPFYTGPGKLASRLHQNVYFGSVYKEKRGHYRVDISLVTDNPAAETEQSIMEKYARLLEKAIIAQPSTWLWSHRRWKHKPA
jgi:Kdo2-lipid IVA lauroyltransferase/acyltransferase